MNNNQSNENKSQNELDLGLNQTDSVIPRKVVQHSESFLDKAKGLTGLFGRKTQPETQFHVRKEPTFGENTVAQEPLQPTQQPTFISEPKSTVENIAQEVEEAVVSTAESVENKVEENVEQVAETASSVTEQAKETLAAGATAATASLKRPEKWKILQILPEKHRRLFIAILALVLLLIIFFALKPNSDTVESFELQNSNEIPVQFQSLDQSQPVETTVLDNIAAQQDSPPVAEQPVQTESVSSEPAKMEYLGDGQKDEAKAPEMPAAPVQTVQQEAAPQPMPVAPAPVRQESVRKAAVTQETVKPAPPVVERRQDKVKTVSQEHKVQKVVQKTAPVAKTTKAEAAPKVSAQEAKAVAKNERKVQIVEAKPAGSSKAVTSSTSSAGTSKTLTVPQGVSLMQVFRDNQLNISDVNAMTKANGAGNTLSNFKPGDKVQVSVNAQGRVSELRLSNGAKFVRQADGSYQFRK
ncbi:opacity-associated protein OapA [Rodentibacter myodis]|uniref:Acetylglucosamine transferase n=1 Tax=Rodentibacter myodis TaxID=1907939 RepID=A0A1V3JTK1_9PAST|nr:opacity-associated protein OapA [Rodentibacter myodis]OOF59985.1 acetylglucosamine transferase [Rodentibacter myodis]